MSFLLCSRSKFYFCVSFALELCIAMSDNSHVIFVKRPGADGVPQPDNFAYEKCGYPTLKADTENAIIIRTVYLSVDPAQRCQMNEVTGVSYVQPWKLNETVLGLGGVGVVVESHNTNFKVGSFVTNSSFGWPWMLYWKAKFDEVMLRVVDLTDPKEELTYYGIPGLTSLIGLLEKGHISNGEGTDKAFVVSGAAGSCGHLAGQFARIYGCNPVIGICGSEEKCNLLKKELQFTNAINYKTENVKERIKELCPNGVDVYFDNVGGSVSDDVIEGMSEDSHVVLCGQISQYNKDVEYPPPLSDETASLIQRKRINRDRFLVLNYQDKFLEARMKLMEMRDSVQILDTIYDGLATTGKAFCEMMKGGNIGKALVRTSQH